MKEVVEEFTARKLGATYFRGSVPIGAIWATSDVTVANACVMPVGYGVGDHCLFVVDFATTSLVGTRCVQRLSDLLFVNQTQEWRGITKP
jgi:hypothetical protein